MGKIMIVDDDPNIRELVRVLLKNNEFDSCEAKDGRDALVQIADENPDLAIIDLMMPNMDGYELCRKLRQYYENLPILMLTAKTELPSKVKGFEAGADDYLPKPFEPRELVLRIRAMLRRAPVPLPEAPPRRLTLGGLSFDPVRGELTGPEGIVRLTGGEGALLTALARKPGEVLSREEIAAALGTEESSERAIDVQVTRLRRKIEVDAREPRFLHTVRGRGYVLKPGT